MSVERKINELTFKNGTKLSEVISFLPNGIIDKTETGIGATYLEATCARNSIIVEPVCSIVTSKAKKHDALAFKGGSDREDVLDYFKRKEGKHKKIFVVSDSVGRLISILIDMNVDVFNKYFFLIDEVEQYQTEANYRCNMGIALDYYKEFNALNRALVTATLYEFSNPVLRAEPLTRYSYETPFLRDVNLRITNNPMLEAISVLEHLKGKNLVFFNSIDGILNLIELGNLPLSECAIYCGEGSKDKVGDLYKEFTSEPNHKYNFYTSAFFSGIDILGDYNVITVMDITRIHTLLFPCKIRQIIGRVRNQVLSDTIISNYTPRLVQVYTNYVEDRLNDACEAIRLIDYNKGIPNNKWFMNIREGIIKKEFDGIMIIREDKDGNVLPNYEEIDYKYIRLWSLNGLYSSLYGLKNFLTGNNSNVTLFTSNRTFSSEHLAILNTYREKVEEERKLAAEAVYSLIKKTENKGVFNLNEIDFRQLMYESTGVTKKLWQFYNEFRDVEALLESKGEDKFLTRYKIEYSFKKLNENHSFKARINDNFIEGKQYTSTEIANVLNEIYKIEIPGSDVLTPNKAITQLKRFCKIKRCKIPDQSSFKRIDGYEIENSMIDKIIAS